MSRVDAEAAMDWNDARRAESWGGEVRVNLIRLLGVLLFYARHLVDYFASAPGAPVRGIYHLQVTAIAMAWTAAVVVLYWRLSRHQYGPETKYLTTLFDALMITILCVVNGGPQTPFMLLYFLLIATAPLRLSLRLVYFATVCAIFGYLFLLGYYAWYVVGFAKYYSSPDLRIPRSHEVIVVLAFTVAGLLAGQSVRQARRIAARDVFVAHAAPDKG